MEGQEWNRQLALIRTVTRMCSKRCDWRATLRCWWKSELVHEAVLVLLWAVLALSPALGTGVPCLASKDDPVFTQLTFSLEERREIIGEIWEKIALWYSYFEEKDIDWDEVRVRYSDEVSRAKSDWDFYRTVSAMVRELRDGHSYVFAYPKPTPVQVGAPRVDIIEADGRPVVLSIAPKSDADAKGVVPGLEIVSVNKTPAGDRIAALIPLVTASTPWYARRVAVASMLNGDVQDEVQVEFRRLDGSTLNLSLKREPVTLQPEGITCKVLDGDVGYMRVPHFSPARLGFKSRNDIICAFDEALERLRGTKALIVDMRGNGGGDDLAAQQCAARLLVAPTKFPGSRMKFVTFGKPWFTPMMERVVRPRGHWQYSNSVVLLIDEMVFSTAEHFAAGLHDSGRAITVGRTTAGSSGNPVKLDVRGFKFQVSRWKEYRVDGSLIEGLGVPADIVVYPKASDIAGGVDTVLERALQYLRSHANS